MKKIFLFLLALLLPMAVLGVGFTVDGINYEPLGGWGNYVTVKGPANNDCPAHVFIPSTVTYEDVTYAVASVSSGAFWGYTNLESIYMSDGLESIDPNTFSYCTSLKQVRFPETLNTILGPGLSHHVGAFEGCTSLESIYLPASMSFKGFATSPNNICRWAFKNCTNLKTVVIAAKQPNIEDEAFINCPSLTCVISYVDPPYQLGDNTFTGLSSNASLIVPDGTKSAYQSLAGWSDFQNIYEHGSYTKAFAVVTAGRGGRISYSGDEVAVGTQVWVIAKGQSASFTITPDDGHKLLKLLKYGQDVTAQVSNGQYTVHNTQQDFTLEAVFEEGEDTPPVGDYITFADPIVEKLCLYYWDTNKDGQLTKQEAAAVTSLGDVFCLNPQKTKSWQGSDGPKDGLQHGNFYWFDELQYFTGLTSIGDDAFYGQQSLQQITLPANVKKIGKHAFYYCWNLQAIHIPNAVETIGEGAFYSCKNAGSLSMGSSVKTIGDGAFCDCANISSVVVPDGCTAIGSSAFLGCTKLQVLTLPASLKNVGTYMIAYAEKAVNIRLGSKDLWQQLQVVCDDDETEDGIVEQSDFKLYYNDQELTEVEIPSTMTKVDNRYKNCQSVKSLTIPATVTDIAVCAFNGCRNLASVTSYLQNPFYIEDAVFEYEDPSTHNDVFTSATLYVPKGTKAKYQSQYGWKSFKNIVEMGGEPVEPEPYVVYSNSGTLTFYYDNQRSSRQGTTYDLNEGATDPKWNEHKKEITKAVFDASFASARPTTTALWFAGQENLTEIVGMENLNTSEVTNMNYMFGECSRLANIDLSHFDTRNVTSMSMMFRMSGVQELDLSSFDTSNATNVWAMCNICDYLTRLTLGSTFVSNETTSVGYMFAECRKLMTVQFTGDIPASINSQFFAYVGSYGSPAKLDVPAQYRDHYKAKFNGNMFFGGYFMMDGEEEQDKVEMSVCIINAINGVVYENNVKTRAHYQILTDERPIYTDMIWSRMENGSWKQFATTEAYSFYNKDLDNGMYKIDYGYHTATQSHVTLGTVQFEVREDNRYSVVVIDSVGDNRMITYSDKQDLDFSSIQGMKAYIAGGFNPATVEVMLMHVTDVPANTGLLLVGNPGCYLIPRSQSHSIYVNLMKAVEEGLRVPAREGENTNYYFDVSVNQFRKIADANGWLAYANGRHGLAYLQIPAQAAAGREVIALKFDDTDGIAVTEGAAPTMDVYTLGGQLLKRGATSLEGLSKGLYIVNGRKVAIK